MTYSLNTLNNAGGAATTPRTGVGRFAHEFAMVVGLVACGAGNDPDGTGGSGAGLSSGTETTTGSSGGSTGAFSDGGGGQAGCAVSCSTDLHSVIDCNGVVVTTCPPDQGCADAGCVPACDAAIANKSSVGCEYYAHNPQTLFGRGCHAMFIANTWNAPITISGEANGQAIDLSKYAYLPEGVGTGLTLSPLGQGQPLAPGGVAVVFLRDSDSGFMGTVCPMPAAETAV